jgi:hypothetical protein
VRLSQLGTEVTVWPIVPAPDDCVAISGMRIGRGNRSIRRKSNFVHTTNPTWPDPDSQLRRRGGIPATKHLSYFIKRLTVILATTLWSTPFPVLFCRGRNRIYWWIWSRVMGMHAKSFLLLMLYCDYICRTLGSEGRGNWIESLRLTCGGRMGGRDASFVPYSWRKLHAPPSNGSNAQE